MMNRRVLSFLVALVAGIPALSRADDSQWQVIRFYTVADGRRVALAVPAEWEDLSGTRNSAPVRALRFMDESGGEFEVPLAALAQASASKPVLEAQDLRKLALRPRHRS
jgi:hypothetical protein